MSQLFFNQLQEFSDRFVQGVLGLESSESPWVLEGFDLKGAVIHYTADEDPLRVLRWFLKEKFNARSSAHAVVFSRVHPRAQEYMQDLPLIQELPVTVVQCCPPDKRAWHATWTNSFCYGIENVNAGELRRGPNGGYVTWRPRDRFSEPWTMPWAPEVSNTPIEELGRLWAPYTGEQVAANVRILKELNEVYRTLRLPLVLGHECVQGVDTVVGGKKLGTDKRDPGPAYPIHGVRKALAGDDTLLSTPNYRLLGEEWRSYNESLGAGQLAGDLHAMLEDPEVPFGRVGTLALRSLGYADGGRESVEIFQRLVGLSVDGDPGLKTRSALRSRLQDRGRARFFAP